MDYKRMYALLCGTISDALDLLPASAETARTRWELEQALHTMEELYMESEE